ILRPNKTLLSVLLKTRIKHRTQEKYSSGFHPVLLDKMGKWYYSKWESARIGNVSIFRNCRFSAAAEVSSPGVPPENPRSDGYRQKVSCLPFSGRFQLDMLIGI
ncbi:MAG: hypothetical protein ACLTCK_07720, partial [Oscillospiraceae bacterium]